MIGVVVGVTAALADVVLRGGGQGDQLGVAGLATGWRLTVASLVPLLALPLAVANVVVFVSPRPGPGIDEPAGRD